MMLSTLSEPGEKENLPLITIPAQKFQLECSRLLDSQPV